MSQMPPQPYPGQPYPGQPQPYPGQPPMAPQPYPGQSPMAPQPYPGQSPFAPQPYPGQPPQPYPAQPPSAPQPYPSQPPSTPQPYPAQPPSAPQPYPSQPPQPYPAQPPVAPQPYPAQPPMAPQPAAPQPYDDQPYDDEPVAPPLYRDEPAAPPLYRDKPAAPHAYPSQTYADQSSPGLDYPDEKKGPNKLVLIIVAVAVVIAGGVGAFIALSDSDDPSKPVPAGEATTPTAAVRGYLQAVADGNASDALSFMTETPKDTTFLTNAVLAASSTITEISTVKSKDSTRDSAMVDATYQMGGESHTVQYVVVKKDKHYFVVNATAKLQVDKLAALNLPITINGASIKDVSGASAQLFPGTYQVVVDSNMVTLDSGDSFQVIDPLTAVVPDMQLSLAPGAMERIEVAADSALTGCLKEKEMVTSCGFGNTEVYNGGKKLTPKSGIKWTVDGKKPDFTKETFNWSPSSPTVASANTNIKLSLTFNATDGKGYTAKFLLIKVTVDFADPADMKVEIKSD